MQTGATPCISPLAAETRANVSRMERGQNVTFVTFARYLGGCGFDFEIRVFPSPHCGAGRAGSLAPA